MVSSRCNHSRKLALGTITGSRITISSCIESNSVTGTNPVLTAASKSDSQSASAAAADASTNGGPGASAGGQAGGLVGAVDKQTEENAKLVYGVVFSLRNIINKISTRQGENFISYRTNSYKLHYFETGTCIKFVMLTDPGMENMVNILRSIYAQVALAATPRLAMRMALPARTLAAAAAAGAGSGSGSGSSSASSDAAAPTPLVASNLHVSLSKNLKKMPPLPQLVFGKTFSDHMLTIEWEATKGWAQPTIKPYGKLALDPSATVFHYAVECFEGMKAYKDKSGKLRLFRPDMNVQRLHNSCKRLTLPTFEKEEMLKLIKEFVKIEHNWVPSDRGYSLYLRPTVIATQESLGVGPSNRALFFLIASPVGPYYKTGFSAVSLFATKDYIRAWPGGTGGSKVGSNYAPGILPQVEVAKKGYQQILWLFGDNDNISEVGTMNFFMLWTNENGVKELRTPPLDGTILPGVTRDSILTLAREWNEFKVVEGEIPMQSVLKALEEGRVHEMFGAGTAAIVSPIKCIHYHGKDLAIPVNKNDPTAQAGPLTQRFANQIMSIQYGDIPHKWSVVID
eukprot:jgi/Hompol1/1927/HPOL_005795-RA